MSQPAAKQQQLQDAFELFTQVSEQLTGSYRGLETQVASLNQELVAAATERSRLLAEIWGWLPSTFAASSFPLRR